MNAARLYTIENAAILTLAIALYESWARQEGEINGVIIPSWNMRSKDYQQGWIEKAEELAK